MDQRIAALESQLAGLKGFLDATKWWGALGIAFLVGALALTNFYSIPAWVNKKFEENSGKAAMEAIEAASASASDSANRIQESAKTIGEFEPIQLYSCPSNTDSEGGSWASYGCVGQLTSQQTCINYAFSGGLKAKTFACTPMTLFKKR